MTNQASKRLDVLLKSGDLKPGSRFLYCVNGAGKCYEGRLLETSPGGDYVRLNDSGCWDYPPEIFVQEIWPEVEGPGIQLPEPAVRFAAPSEVLAAPPSEAPASTPTTPTKPKRRHIP